jgi:hypothetical protein
MLQSRYIELGKVLLPPTANVHKKPAVSCQLSGLFLSHCIPEAKEDISVHLSVHTTPFCNQLLVGETMTVKGNLQTATRIVMKTLMPPVALYNVHLPALAMSFEADLLDETQNVVLLPTFPNATNHESSGKKQRAACHFTKMPKMTELALK